MVSEYTDQILMDIIHIFILEKNISGNPRFRILLAMIYIKNKKLTKALSNNIIYYEAQNQEI